MQQPWRRDAIGGSDAPALAGVDPFQTAGDVWARLTGRLPQDDDDASTGLTPLALGTALGPLLVTVAARKLGRPVAPEVWYRHPTLPMACSVDGIALDPPATLIEAKTSGLLGPAPAVLTDAYGDDGTDEVPESVIIQVHHAFAVLDAQPNMPPIRVALVPVLLGGRGCRCYRIERDDAIVAELVDLERSWWTGYVEGDRCPPNDPPSLATLRRFHREPMAPPMPVDPVYVTEWLQAKAVRKQAEANEEHLQRLILTALGAGEAGICDLGRLTYKATQRQAYTVKATTVRTLRFTPNDRRKVA
jgi:predicted phage-related endonuclease